MIVRFLCIHRLLRLQLCYIFLFYLFYKILQNCGRKRVKVKTNQIRQDEIGYLLYITQGQELRQMGFYVYCSQLEPREGHENQIADSL